jgi:large subunit ribosomal protein L7/L12
MAINIEKLAEDLVSLTIKEASELSKILEDKYGIKPASVQVSTVSEGSKSAVVEEKNSFNIVLKSVSGNKLSVVKTIKDVFGLDLKSAKDLVDSAPKTLKENVKKEEAESIKKTLEESGAVIELS